MRTAFVDYETYWSDDYTLGKMTTAEYLADERFHAHGMCVAIDDGPIDWIEGSDLEAWWRDYADQIDTVCAHNGSFDHAITRKFTDKRFFLLDTKSMAQGALAFRHPHLRMSLAALAKHYWPHDFSMWKMEGVLESTKNVERLSGLLKDNTIIYCRQDTRICRELFRRLLSEEYPWHTELHNIHITLAMSVYPVLEMDNILATKIHLEEVRRKEEFVKQLGIDRKELRSADKFADLLRRQGVEAPTKISLKTGKTAYAFAAKDPDFIALKEHPNLNVQALVEARLGEKAAQVESRALKFSRLPSPLPVPLLYAGAHTGRHTGTDGFNMQNLKKGSDLRACVRSPKGHKLLVADLAQIELRVNAWWCGETWLVEALRAGRDVYCELASGIFGRTITKADEQERFIGKTGELSLGFSAGSAKFHGTLESYGLDVDVGLAEVAVAQFRAKHPAIVRRWKELRGLVIPVLAGEMSPTEINGVYFEKGRATLPSGRSLWYPELELNEEGEWTYLFRGRGKPFLKRLWHGLLLENVVQAMAYDVFMFHARMLEESTYHPVMVVHDETAFVIPENAVERVMESVLAVQSITPGWCKDLPVKGEADYGDTYLEAK